MLTLYLDLVKEASAPLAGSVVQVCCGSRIDLLDHTLKRVKALWPRARAYVIQLTTGSTQTLSRKPGFLVQVELTGGQPSTTTSALPAMMDVLASRASSLECTRLRCMSKSCPLRSENEQQKLDPSKAGDQECWAHRLFIDIAKAFS